MSIRQLFHNRPETAFVLGGGGNLGAIQVGQLRALVERGITPDVVIGCSVGALNAAAIAGSPTLDEIGRLAGLWSGLVRDDVFSSPGVARGPWQFLRSGLAAFNDNGLKRLIGQWLRYTTFEDATVPLWVVATSLRTGLETWFNTGDVTAPLLASTALPGVFPPVDIDGDSYIDGGVVNNVPVSKGFDLRAKRMYVLDVGNFDRERPAPRRPYEVLMRAVSIARAHRFRTEQDRVPEGVRMIRMPMVDPGKLRYYDFHRSAELIERGYQASASFLDSAAHAETA
jgi:NTE family protein